jgi:hypothetical protein
MFNAASFAFAVLNISLHQNEYVVSQPQVT